MPSRRAGEGASDDHRRQRAARSARARGTPDPGRHDRRRLHGPGPREPDREQRPRDARWWRSTAAAPSGRRRVYEYAGLEAQPSWRPRRASSRTRCARASRSSPRTRSCSAAPSRSTCSSTSPDRSSSARRSRSRRSSTASTSSLMNAELDATIGPILQTYASKHGVILSACDGDEPGVQMNLYRWVQGPRAHAAGDRERQGSAGSVPQADDPEGLRGEVGSEPGDGDVVRRRLEDQLRADDRGQRDGLQGAPARHVARHASSTAHHWSSLALRPRRGASARRRSSTTPSGPSSVKVFCLAEHSTIRSSVTTSTCTRWATGRSTRSGSRTTCPLRGAERDRAGRPLRRRPGSTARRSRSSRCARSPSATSRPARCSTSTACS